MLSMVEHETIFHHLLEPKDQERPSRASLIDEAFTLVSAGSDTVGNALNIGTFYALKYPSINKKLKEELEEIWVDKDRPMSYTALENLPYLTAFIKEVLRFSIGIIHPLPRVVGPSTPSPEIGGFKIPAGTTVKMSTMFLHMNPDVFPDPSTFNPDRWLVEDINEMMLNFAPFSKGPRMWTKVYTTSLVDWCLVNWLCCSLAWCELYLIFGNIFRRLDLKLLVTEDTIDDFALKNCGEYLVPRWEKGYQFLALALAIGSSPDERGSCPLVYFYECWYCPHHRPMKVMKSVKPNASRLTVVEVAGRDEYYSKKSNLYTPAKPKAMQTLLRKAR
ncbi:cytochrome P450 [Rhodocollybia butyracea]|uniref:Cytochrome P450 n=1 Tax=Rhodocollybia butyracea TaxID=206335 RepID=A0A9P5UG14_9AGAR|nr:cytochrome P450 [Rhodocollybia butyracea]